MQTLLLGDITGVSERAGVLHVHTREADLLVTIYRPTVIRVCIVPPGKAPDPSFAVIREPECSIAWRDLEDHIEVTTDSLRLEITRSPVRISLYDDQNVLLSADDPRFGSTRQQERIVTYRKLFADEKFIGLGEKTGNLNRRGCAYVNWNSDVPYHNNSSDPLYKTFPFFIGIHSQRCYGLFFDNPQKSYFDFGATTDNSMSWFGADGGDMNYYLFGSGNIPGILRDYTWLTGRMEMPPLWSLGYQQCRWSYTSAEEVLQVARTFRERNIPADVIYCDIHYMDQYKIFTWDPQAFPDPAEMIRQLHEMGFRIVTIVDPGIKIEPGYHAYDEGVANQYFATYPNGELFTAEVWPGRCHFPDFFRDEVRQWWGKSFTALTDPGVDGFWNDMNEPAAWGQHIPWLVELGEHSLHEVRNAYGSQMARATYDGTRALLGNRRPFVLTRAAYAGVQRYSAIWTGDNSATDEHLLLGQRLVNSLGLAGMAFTGVDIGGFMGDPSPELMLRWNSLGPYVPMFRNHAVLGSRSREPWTWGEANEAILRKDIGQRYRLLPYLYSCFHEASTTGMPVARSLAIFHPHTEEIYYPEFQNQFYFGPALLVAPAESFRTEIPVYLPPGDWYRLSTGQKETGEQIINAAAPLDDLPVFVKAGAIIPMQPVVQHSGDRADGILELHVWNGTEPTEFPYYEDDGETYDYENGHSLRRIFRFEPSEGRVVVSGAEGNFTSRYHTVQLHLHNFPERTSLSDLERIVGIEEIIFNYK